MYYRVVLNLWKELYEVSYEFIFMEDYVEFWKFFKKLIEKEINFYVDEWENLKRFFVYEVFKKLGLVGFFGVNKFIKYGGLGLDYFFSVVMVEELG